MRVRVEISAEQAQTCLKQLLEAALRGEQVFIRTEGGIVHLVAFREPRARRFGSAKGQVVIRDDFDAPLEDMAPYTQ